LEDNLLACFEELDLILKCINIIMIKFHLAQKEVIHVHRDLDLSIYELDLWFYVATIKSLFCKVDSSLVEAIHFVTIETKI